MDHGRGARRRGAFRRTHDLTSIQTAERRDDPLLQPRPCAGPFALELLKGCCYGQPSKLLRVPYFTQSTENTWQSTVLKMFAYYLEREILKDDSGAANLKPIDIYKTIHTDPNRPNKKFTNAHANMKWWLEQRYPTLTFKYITTALDFEAIDAMVNFIDADFPVLVAVSHANVEGHIVLVIGYRGYIANSSSIDFKIVVHDPYGAFDPTLLSKA